MKEKNLKGLYSIYIILSIMLILLNLNYFNWFFISLRIAELEFKRVSVNHSQSTR